MYTRAHVHMDILSVCSRIVQYVCALHNVIGNMFVWGRNLALFTTTANYPFNRHLGTGFRSPMAVTATTIHWQQ